MFTGLIDHCGKIIHSASNELGMNLQIQCQFDDLILGESIALNGVCVTAVDPQAQLFSCSLSPETIAKTTMMLLKEGDTVNLERALRLSDRLGGHIVTGHVDAYCKLKNITAYADYSEYVFSGIDKNKMKYLIDKGSVAINGVSLTINTIFSQGFSVMLIPHTLAKTNLAQLVEGQSVNIEFDYLAKIVARQLQTEEQTV